MAPCAYFVTVVACLCMSASAELDLEITHKVFFDVTIGGEEAGRIELGVYGNALPKTCRNFVTLATDGTTLNGAPVSYQGTLFQRVIQGFMIQGGDIGNGGFSIYNNHGRMADENLSLKHSGPGVLAMANSGEPDTNGSQFYITLDAQPQLDGKFVVFGNVTAGMDVVRRIGGLKTDDSDKPEQDVLIAKSGLLWDNGKGFPSSADATLRPTLRLLSLLPLLPMLSAVVM